MWCVKSVNFVTKIHILCVLNKQITTTTTTTTTKNINLVHHFLIEIYWKSTIYTLCAPHAQYHAHRAEVHIIPLFGTNTRMYSSSLFLLQIFKHTLIIFKCGNKNKNVFFRNMDTTKNILSLFYLLKTNCR